MNEFRALRLKKEGTFYKVQKMHIDTSWRRRFFSIIVFLILLGTVFLVLDRCVDPGVNYLETEIKAGAKIADVSTKDFQIFALKSLATIVILVSLIVAANNYFYNIFLGQPVWTDLPDAEAKKLFEPVNHLSKVEK